MIEFSLIDSICILLPAVASAVLVYALLRPIRRRTVQKITVDQYPSAMTILCIHFTVPNAFSERHAHELIAQSMGNKTILVINERMLRYTIGLWLNTIPFAETNGILTKWESRLRRNIKQLGLEAVIVQGRMDKNPWTGRWAVEISFYSNKTTTYLELREPTFSQWMDGPEIAAELYRMGRSILTKPAHDNALTVFTHLSANTD